MRKTNYLLLSVLFLGLLASTSCKNEEEVDGGYTQFMEELSAPIAADGGSITLNTKPSSSFFYIDNIATIQNGDTTKLALNATSIDIQTISDDWYTITTEANGETGAPTSVNAELSANVSGEERVLLINVYSGICSNTLTITQAAQSEKLR